MSVWSATSPPAKTEPAHAAIPIVDVAIASNGATRSCRIMCMRSTLLTTCVLTAAAAVIHPASAFDAPTTDDDAATAPDFEQWIARGVEYLLERQEGDDRAEWPYEGVYRVGRRREIPIGYRVGGTGIAGTALLTAPGLDDDDTRQSALQRATEFICDAVDHPLMAHSFESTYDVRGWGYTFGLSYLLHARRANIVNDDMHERVERAVTFYIEGIVATEIPRNGGWNYARRAGFDNPGPPSPFMTGSTLQALFEAKAEGYRVPDDVIMRGLDALAAAKLDSGGYVYSGRASDRSRDGVPGAVGRMLVAENTLFLAGRANASDVRSGLDAFIVHWDWLEARRAKDGTHEPPYGVAPYYFYYAHYYAAQAIELLPMRERAEYRRRVRELLNRTRSEDGTWNDRVFERSAAYGTAMAMLAAMMPDADRPSRWQPEPVEPATRDE